MRDTVRAVYFGEKVVRLVCSAATRSILGSGPLVRSTVPADRLFEWSRKDGREPMCELVPASAGTRPT